MKIGAIILCRLSSKRLPGKVLMNISGKPVLRHIVDRLQLVDGLSEIIIATSRETSDNAIEDFAKENKIECYRGDLDNVANRFLQCAKQFNLDYAIRINGDNVFVDCKTMQKMIADLHSQPIEFASNVPGRTFPYGMSIEMVSVSFFGNLLNEISSDNRYKEHVTLFLYENESRFLSKFRFYRNNNEPRAAGIKLALDTEDDLRLISFIAEQLNKHNTEYTLKDVVNKYYEFLDR